MRGVSDDMVKENFYCQRYGLYKWAACIRGQENIQVLSFC